LAAPPRFAAPPASRVAGEPGAALPVASQSASASMAGLSGMGAPAANPVDAKRQSADRILTSDDFDGASWEIVAPGVTEVSPRFADSPRPPGSRMSSSAPPAWVLPDQPDEADEDPLARLGVSESWAGPPASPPDESGLSAAGAFGRQDERKERRMGLRAFDPGRRGVRALAVVAVLVIVVAAFLAWRARPRVDPVAAPSFEAGATTDEPAVPSPVASAEVIVAVEGKVRQPGVVHLPAGSRVADALEAAGGAQPGVDVAMLNLARKVVDGELILVGVTPSPGMSMPAAAAGGAATPGGLVNLNTATLADLDTLPGVGPVLAQRILDARTAQGGFKAVSDLRKVDGIGDARYEQLKDLVTV
jgi:competence protein ComEA